MTETKKNKTGIFSGSFNPIHIGHLALANYLCEFEGFDEIWFLVTPQNPLKVETQLWADDVRLHLVKIAIEGYPRFHASDFEFHLPRPSYSVYTLEQLRLAYPDRDFYFIIGSDNWVHFDKWYEPERIINENNLIIYPRPGYDIDKNTLPTNVHLADSPVFEISSSFIREAITQKKDVRYFVHPSVWEYISTHLIND